MTRNPADPGRRPVQPTASFGQTLRAVVAMLAVVPLTLATLATPALVAGGVGAFLVAAVLVRLFRLLGTPRSRRLCLPGTSVCLRL